jgi:hypothetical protein
MAYIAHLTLLQIRRVAKMPQLKLAFCRTLQENRSYLSEPSLCAKLLSYFSSDTDPVNP